MKTYQLRIELLSDMCVSDGGVYNSSLDIDICHDKYGFPYIPAKRLKGCLRECALELQDWGKEISVRQIFGEEGEQKGNVSIRNAYIENYSELKKQIESHPDNVLFYPQNILSHYSYIRTQTRVDYETGTAKENSLRTMRVINKGLVFISEIEMDIAYENIFCDIVSVFHQMGISRTRGLGEIKAELLPLQKSENEMKMIDMEALKRQIEREKCLKYSVYLEEPIVCKSIDGGESHSLDYIQGSQILGIILQELKNNGEDVGEFLSQSSDMFFSNAYLETNGRRLLETPCSFYSVKNNDQKYINKAVENENNRLQTKEFQLNPMKHCYVDVREDGSLIKKSVAMEERYHHRRPEDKSIGRVVEGGTGNGVFYQISSIAAGQSFQGYISGPIEQLWKVAECLTKHLYYSIGAARSSEYGKVKITPIVEENDSTSMQKGISKVSRVGMDLQIKLESPTIVYSRENVTYSTDVEDLCEEINVVLGLENKPDDIKKYINYTSVGGFNVTWNMRKPTVDAFDKGTVLIYHFETRPSFSVDLQQERTNRMLIGERTMEGYGEISVCEICPETMSYIGEIREIEKAANINGKLNVSELNFAAEICERKWKEYLQIQSTLKAKSFSRNRLEKAKPTISNMLIMCVEQVTWTGIQETVRKRYEKNSEVKAEKKKIAEDIIKTVEEEINSLPQKFMAHYRICGWEAELDYSRIEYLKSYLIELKYCARNVEEKKGGAKYESQN